MTQEVDCLIAFVEAAKIPGIYPGYTTNGKHAPDSRHGQKGTTSGSGDVGLAVDFDAPGNDPKALLACAELFSTVSHQLYELFHTPLHFSIKDGVRVSWTIPDHFNHVHVAVKKGVFLSPLWPTTIQNESEDNMDPDFRVAAVRAPEGGTWVLTRDGGVRAEHGAPFFGSYPGLPPKERQGERYFIDIEANGPKNSDGYCVLASDGSTYSFPTR